MQNRQNQPSLPHQVDCVLIPARVEHTFYLSGNLEFTSGKDTNTTLSVYVGAGSSCRAMVLLHAHFVTFVK